LAELFYSLNTVNGTERKHAIEIQSMKHLYRWPI